MSSSICGSPCKEPRLPPSAGALQAGLPPSAGALPALSQGLRDKLSQERAAVAKQLEQCFSMYMVEHHKALIDQVQQFCRDGQHRVSPDNADNILVASTGGPKPPETGNKPPASTKVPREMEGARMQDLLAELRRHTWSNVELRDEVCAKLQQVDATSTLVADNGASSTGNGAPMLMTRALQASDFKAVAYRESVLAKKVDLHEVQGSAQTLDKNMGKLDGLDCKYEHEQRLRETKLPILERLKHEVTGHRWEFTVAAIIICNALVMSFELQYIGMETGEAMGYPSTAALPKWVETAINAANDMFLCIFLLELLVKLLGLRIQFWRSGWDVLDFFIVAIGLVCRLTNLADIFDPTILRLVRLVRLVRFLKMFTVAGTLHSMNLILKSVMASGGTLFWSMVLLSMVQWLASMFVGQMTQGYIQDASNSLEARQEVFKYYGTFTKTQFTMFEVTHVNYSRAARVLADNVSEWWGWFFVIYRCTVAFAFVQVVRSVFIQTTMKVADNDKDLLIHNKRTAMLKLHKKLDDIFMMIDADSSGTIPHDEFLNELQQESTKIWMSSLDIDVGDAEGLFELLDLHGTGDISRDEFTYGAAKLRGVAQCRDVFYMQTLLERIEAKLDTLLVPQFRGRVFPMPVTETKDRSEDTS